MHIGFFTVSSDGCDAQGDCVSSRNYSIPYGNDESCSIASDQDVDVGVGPVFELATCCDHLMINGDNTGSSGAVPATLASGSAITWSSDVSVSSVGWQPCFSERSTLGAPLLSTLLPLPYATFADRTNMMPLVVNFTIDLRITLRMFHKNDGICKDGRSTENLWLAN